MSVQNPERLATKQDLADMYQGILPYLGGMPEMVANKFSKGDLYSTDEKMIGQYIDGKPLYQRFFNPVSITQATESIVVWENSGVDTIVKQFGHTEWTSNSGHQTAFPYISNVATGEIQRDETNGNIKIVTKDLNGCTIIAGMQYTKTTDSTVSIGEETEYSTTEKIVGTWIDGKPIYQRTINITLPTCVTNGVPVWDLTSISFNFIIDTLVSRSGHFNVNKAKMSIPYMQQLSDKIMTCVDARAIVTDGVQKFAIYNSNPAWSGATGYVTIQYTKTD